MTINFGINTTKIQGNKKTICSLSLILILAVSMIIAFAQPALAQVGIPQPEKTTGYIDVAPRLLGAGQTATVNLFIYPIPTNYAYEPYYDGYRGVTVTFTRPDGTKDTFMPVDGTNVYAAGQTQSLGAIYFFYKPNQVGDWSVSFTMPAQNLTDVSGTVLMQGCTSNTAAFTVQSDPVLAGLLNGYPWSPLPNANVFWSYPISSNNREWSQISGDWLGMDSTGAIVNNPTCRLWQPYGSGPNTGHVVWKYPFRMGGIAGGDYGSLSYGAQGSRISNVIIQGKVFQNIENAGKFACIDLATGKVLYTADGTIAHGLHQFGDPYRQAGYSPTGNVVLESSDGSTPTAYLIATTSTTWRYYDPLTGALVRTITGASGGFRFVDGSPLAFGIRNDKLVRWNMSKVASNNWTTGIEWEVQVPESLVDPLEKAGARSSSIVDSVLTISADISTVVVKGSPGQYWGYSAETGARIWELILDYPTTANQQIRLYPMESFLVLDVTESRFKCYSIKTGALQWTSDSFSDATWATTWTVYLSSTNDLDNLYVQFSDCTVRAYSLADGHEVWRSEPIPSTEYPNNVVPYVQSMLMVDGKIYSYAGYSSSYKINPIPRHSMIVCIDAATGDTLFTVNGGIRVSAAADGYVIGTGDFDGNLWCLGKGPVKTTVTASPKVFAQGSSVLIEGSVIDMSSINQDEAIQARFPNGVPAVADEDMSEWMDYVHFQNATLLNNPPAPSGVSVWLTAVSSNGDAVDIGTVTSDSGGMFKKTWTPPSEGEYTVYATFDGSNSYYGSYAETALSVTKAPETTNSGGTEVQPVDNTMTIVGVGAVLAILILIVGVLLYRKK